ncbi:hypothetical protein NM680_04050 [Paracoccus sp. PS-1]|uniref:hypothetical protein n=1 Tax=unclassified Paracoccus (in: a-proteobacteria) TaxID=2688777 RepID=UPI00048FE4A3|nr:MULTISPECIES: hypothetical protein [unclassified Paracoccus (in: a-proteobacteria)]MDQ7260972.1 hypothetical protein [Paracoccus sp. PS1]RQP04400.1 MAG: hypothetical protein D1H97_18175 [Paracoccus sp. BP8]UFM63824.1 hypothetical protein LOS78_06560 [Paracoccus sp. MA]
MKLGLTLAGGALLLAGCAGTDRYGDIIARSVPPSDSLKAEIVKGAERLVYDPASIRYAEISNVATFADGLQGVCVRADSKNVSGVYVGVHNIGIPIRDGKPAGGSLDHPICNRTDVPWHKFPELERLGAR